VQFSLGWQTTCDLDAHAYLFDDYYQKIDHVYKGDLQVGLPSGLSNRGLVRLHLSLVQPRDLWPNPLALCCWSSHPYNIHPSFLPHNIHNRPGL
jgi:hypothetical protein